jgi:hypothetical protein
MRGAATTGHGHLGDASGGDRVARLGLNSPFRAHVNSPIPNSPADPHRDTLRRAAVPPPTQSLFRQQLEMKCALRTLLTMTLALAAVHAALATQADQVADSTGIANQIGMFQVQQAKFFYSKLFCLLFLIFTKKNTIIQKK